MEENEKDRYVFEILALFEQEIDAKLQEEKGEAERIKYYEKFNINGIDFENIFITTERDEKGKVSYHVYCGGSSNEVLSIDDKGNVTIKNEELGKYLGEDVDLEKTMTENEKDSKGLRGISEKMKQEEEKEQKEQDKPDESDKETEKIEEELEEQGEEDLRISKYRKIKDTGVAERMPEVFGDSTENGIAFSNKLNRYIIISKVNGKTQINDNVEPARMTWKSIISIDPNGKSVERKMPHALMKTNRSDKEIAVTIGQYGEVDIETVDVLPCQERISREVRVDGEGTEKQESREIRNQFAQEGKEYKHDIAHQVKDIEQAQKDANKTVDYDITEDDYIPNTEMTWGELMEETGESLPKLIERYNREMGKQDAKSEDVVETIENDYGNISHERGLN